MRLTLDIQDNNAIAFLNYIKSLDYVTIKSEEYDSVKPYELTEEQLNRVEERRVERLNGVSRTHSWESLKEELKNRLED
jgi:hypothetical protein